MVKLIKIKLSGKKGKKWDKKIAEWLETIPAGYRSQKVKELLYNAITQRQIVTPEEPITVPVNQSSHVDEKLSKLVKF